MLFLFYIFFIVLFFNDTATTEIYTLSLHDALPIFEFRKRGLCCGPIAALCLDLPEQSQDRKSTRLNSSHVRISYAVFCLKKQKTRRPAADPLRTDQRRYVICMKHYQYH